MPATPAPEARRTPARSPPPPPPYLPACYRLPPSCASSLPSRLFSRSSSARSFDSPPAPPPLHGRGRQPGRPPLRVTASLDQSRPLQHLQMLRYRRHAHLERRRQLGHRRLTVHQPRQNRPSRRISQRRERRTQGIGRSTHRRHVLHHPVS